MVPSLAPVILHPILSFKWKKNIGPSPAEAFSLPEVLSKEHTAWALQAVPAVLSASPTALWAAGLSHPPSLAAPLCLFNFT